jgi:ribosomal protein L11 methyltransferase
VNWIQVTVKVDGEAAEAVAEALRPFAHGGVSLEQAAADLSPGAARPQLEEEITVSIYYPAAEDSPARRRRLEEILWHMSQLYPIPAPAFQAVREEDWANAWKQHYRPLRIGRHLLICPAWESVHARPDDILITMDPGMAFGTGLHPTTRMCLEAIEARFRPGMTVLDMGTGSGILAIAAALLGARFVLALDTDEVAVQAARQNCAINGVSDVVTVRRGSLADLQPSPQWDLILANILAPVILDMLRAGMASLLRPGGTIVLAGIIEDQANEVEEVLPAEGLALLERLQVRDWATLVAGRLGE